MAAGYLKHFIFPAKVAMFSLAPRGNSSLATERESLDEKPREGEATQDHKICQFWNIAPHPNFLPPQASGEEEWCKSLMIPGTDFVFKTPYMKKN